jgi:hypothetical protein
MNECPICGPHGGQHIVRCPLCTPADHVAFARAVAAVPKDVRDGWKEHHLRKSPPAVNGVCECGCGESVMLVGESAFLPGHNKILEEDYRHELESPDEEVREHGRAGLAKYGWEEE